MPTPLHDAFVTFFNLYPHCALRLAEGLGLDVRAPLTRWRSVSTTFGDPGMCGKEFHADVVLAAFPPEVPDTPAGAHVAAPALAVLTIEPQLQFDEQKGVSWLVYRAGVAARYGPCPAWVLVVTLKADLALRFRTEVYPDQPENWPIFVTAGSVTPVLDQDAANADPAWAALCAVLHARGPHAVAAAVIALNACANLPADGRSCIITMIDAGLRKKDMQQVRREIPEETRRKWEVSEYEREGALFQEGLAEGRRNALLDLLTAHEITLTAEQRARLDACSDPNQLQRWFKRAIQAASAAEIFGTND